ncbi:hypothetical protein [Pseudoxanthomonas winnipegensis]|uniref:hypothetical protein n=1 Tax=Pseudoxanthomonas winnipegensis TaxID=2480810 RepID=UPI00103E4EFA|nr:hypothetical protein [Pseudoxanthomonas winnipegensis]TBV75824.1 hypothetical protein EYC45_05090 [Pseudoxanthomonas winnipegensis]
MKPLPETLTALLELAIYAVRQGTPTEVEMVLGELDAARRALDPTIDSFDYPSYAAGAFASLREVVNRSFHRAALNSVVDGVRSAQRGLDVLRAAGRAAVLGQRQPQKALANQIGMNEGNFSRLAKRLMQIGALEVHREGASSYLRPTAIGEAALDEMHAGWRAASPVEEADRPTLQLSQPFDASSARPRPPAFGGIFEVERCGNRMVTKTSRHAPKLVEQTDTAATA